MQYSLTEATKDTARKLVANWMEEELQQTFTANYIAGDNQIRAVFITPDSDIDISKNESIWIELEEQGLIKATKIEKQNGSFSYQITMLQELHNAVNNDFTVSPYYLAKMGASSDISDFLWKLLSNQIESNEALAEAINELRSTDDKSTTAGKIFKQLGNSLEHGANAGTIIQAVTVLAQWLG